MVFLRFAIAASLVFAAASGLAEEAASNDPAQPSDRARPSDTEPSDQAELSEWNPPPVRAIEMGSPAAEPPSPQEPSDPRVPSGVALGLLGGLMMGAGIATYNDSEGQELDGSLAVGTMIGGVTALAASAAFLGYAGIEGADTPRNAPRKVAAGQILTGIGFAYTTLFSIALIHGYYENDDGRFFVYLGHAPAGGIMVAGVPIWLAGARDVELAADQPTRVVTRSPAMAAFGGMMTLGGLGACGTSIVVLTGAENSEKPVMVGTLAAVGAVTTTLGATLLTFGITDAEIPRHLPDLSIGPGSAELRLALD
jgi:hypothetical protein